MWEFGVVLHTVFLWLTGLALDPAPQVSYVSGWPRTPYVAKDDFEFQILLHPPLEFWGLGTESGASQMLDKHYIPNLGNPF